MLTIAFALSAIPALSAASPVDQTQGGLQIALHKRSLGTTEQGAADLEFLTSRLALVSAKYSRSFEAYENNVGEKHPLDGGTPIPDKPKSTRATGANALSDDMNGSMWQGQISVGSPPLQYSVDFDTGSSDTYLPGPQCSQNCVGHKSYNPGQSTTAKDLQKQFTLSYGDGSSVSGDQYSDTVSIAGMTVNEQTVGVANSMSAGDSINVFPPDGLVGMGFQSISAFDAPPLFQSLVSQGQTSEPVFGFKLAAEGSELYLGGVNRDLFTGDFSYTSVTKQGYWQVNMDGVYVNGNQVESTQQAIIDTGTTMVVGPANVVQDFYSHIPGSAPIQGGLYTIPCDSIPTVGFSFGGKAFNIAPQLFNRGPVRVGDSGCVGGIVGSSATTFWVVGDLFLQNVYTEFDLGNNRVGFAELK